MTDDRVRYVVLPVADVERSARFYQAFGCALDARDGARWAGVSSDRVAISLCGPQDPKRPEAVTLAIVVDDLELALTRLADHGGQAATRRTDGQVEAVDPDGAPLLLVPRQN
jgi:predicted enzyme related to lactoylglutathione lyase